MLVFVQVPQNDIHIACSSLSFVENVCSNFNDVDLAMPELIKFNRSQQTFVASAENILSCK